MTLGETLSDYIAQTLQLGYTIALLRYFSFGGAIHSIIY
jgi:uncharacterized membrane-anchored protein